MSTTGGQTLSVTVGASDLTDAITELNVKQDVEAPSWFSLHFQSGEVLDFADDGTISLGTQVTVQLSDDTGNLVTVIQGEITSLAIETSDSEGSTNSLIVYGCD